VLRVIMRLSNLSKYPGQWKQRIFGGVRVLYIYTVTLQCKTYNLVFKHLFLKDWIRLSSHFLILMVFVICQFATNIRYDKSVYSFIHNYVIVIGYCYLCIMNNDVQCTDIICMFCCCVILFY